MHTSQVLFQAVASLPGLIFGDDDDRGEEYAKLLRAAILGPFAGLPILGDTLSAAGTLVTNWFFDQKEKVWKPKFLPFEAAGKLVDLLKDTFKSFDDGQVDAEEFFKILHDYARSVDLVMPPQLGGGIPKEPPIKFFEWFFSEPEE